MTAIKETKFQFEGQTGFYKGKVRDVYYFENQLVVIASDRISAFDVVLPRAIPYKGQVLNQIAEKFLTKGKEIALEGKLINRSYTDKDGVKKYITEVQVNELLMIGGEKPAA